MRELLLNQKDIVKQLKEIAHKVEGHDENINLIFEYLRQLEQSRQQQDEQAQRKRIGFLQND